MSLIPEGCDQCPNRRKKISFYYISKRNAFAGVLTLILLTFVFEFKDGKFEIKDNPDLAAISGLTTMIAGVLELKLTQNN